MHLYLCGIENEWEQLPNSKYSVPEVQVAQVFLIQHCQIRVVGFS